MCYHNAIAADGPELSERYDSYFDEIGDYKPIYHENGFSFTKRPVITAEQPDKIQLFNWGLIPFWTKSKDEAEKIKTYTLNAMSETVFEKPSFRAAIKSKRCLIPSTGFFEWREFKKKKYPYYIHLKDEKIFSMGGIYEEWVDKETGEIKHTYSIITTAANPLIEKIHNVKKRMPLIFIRENERTWLDEGLSKEQIIQLMRPLEEKHMEGKTISKLITSRTENSNVPEIISGQQYPELVD